MKRDLDRYNELLPCFETMQWLSFMISLNLTVNQDFSNPKVKYKLKENKLKICLEKSIYLVESEVDKLQTPNELKLKVVS